jgi:galactonate dehydratase
MKIVALETIRLTEFGNLLWLRVHTSEGLTGLGETFMAPETVEAYVHEVIAPKLIGRDPLQIDLIARDLNGYLGFRSTGAEARGNSALDIALWDLFGKVVGQPIAQLLGGFSRDRTRTYNTCAGSAYMRRDAGQSTANWGLSSGVKDYDDLNGFLHRADELAVDLLSEGISAMKIWPFDLAAEATGGVDISTADLKAALKPFEKIRSAVGDRMDVMVEFHSLWHLLPAMRIAKALAPFDTKWHEDPIKMDSLASSSGMPRFRPRRSAPRRRSAAGGHSVIFSRRARPASSCWISPGAADCRRHERSRRWRKPGICRSRRTTAPGRSCCAPRPTCRSTRRTRSSRRACAPTTGCGTAIS